MSHLGLNTNINIGGVNTWTSGEGDTSRSKGQGFKFLSLSYVYCANFLNYAGLVHTTLLGTLWNKNAYQLAMAHRMVNTKNC